MKKIKFLVLLSLILTTNYSCTNGNSTDLNFVYKKSPSLDIVAKIGDSQISRKDFENGIEGDLYEAEKRVHEIKMARIRAMILEKLVKDNIKKGETQEMFLEKQVFSKIKITKKQIDDFIKERKIPQNQINDQIKERVKNYLTMQEKKKSVDTWMAKKSSGTSIELYFNKPEVPSYEIALSSNVPRLGNKNAKVTIVEFSDFQCPFCAKGADIMGQVKKKYGNKVSIVFKNFPLPFHSQAKPAAHAALCGKKLGGDKVFWKMHDEMFKNQSNLDENGLLSLVKKLNLDSKKFTDCQSSKEFMATIDRDIEDGKKYNVKSTPTFFVNGKLVNGAQPIEVFSELIDQELK